MDPKDKEIADLKAKVTELEGTIQQKDILIEQKNQDIVGARRETQKLKELTETEKEAMTAREIELHNAALTLQADQEKFQSEQKEVQKRQVKETKQRLIAKLAGKNPEIAKKVAENLSKINGVDNAITESELAPFITDAYNMLGTLKPATVNNVLTDGSGDAPDSTTQTPENFAEQPEGVALAGALGLAIGKPDQK
jgi:hypothetical protein